MENKKRDILKNLDDFDEESVRRGSVKIMIVRQKVESVKGI